MKTLRLTDSSSSPSPRHPRSRSRTSATSMQADHCKSISRDRRLRRILRRHPISTSIYEPSPHWPPSRLLQEASEHVEPAKGPDLTIPPVHRGQPPAR